MKIHLIVQRDEYDDGSPTDYAVSRAYDAEILLQSKGSRMQREVLLEKEWNGEVIIEVPDGTLELAFPEPPVVEGEVAS